MSLEQQTYALYQRANRFLDEDLIRTGPLPPDPRTRREWMEWLLPALGDPQLAYPAVHVAGTSGKGSVAVIIAEILRAAGRRTGLHVSPYLQVSTEKLWVDGRYASATELAALAEWIRPIVEAHRRPEVPLHGMAAVAVALEHFRRQRVDLAVVEVGVGGRDDLTNVLRTRLAVITPVGLDHQRSLGPDLASIARHKAGIIRPGCRAVILENNRALEAARWQAAEVGAPLRVLERARFSAERDGDGVLSLSFRGERFELRDLVLGMAGEFQAENAALALAAVEELVATGEPIGEQAIREGLARARLPGRLELLPGPAGGAAVLLDGAHNHDKLAALLQALPAPGSRRLHVVFGALASRSLGPVLGELARVAASVVTTEPRVFAKPAAPADELMQLVRAGCPAVRAAADPGTALELALDAASPGDLVLVTGSLYLCGELRGRWFPPAGVVWHRSSWFQSTPENSGDGGEELRNQEP